MADPCRGRVAALYFWYASIITRRNKVREALSSVDVHLNQRHDLIPNIVALAGRYMEHERALLTDVTRLREQARTTARRRRPRRRSASRSKGSWGSASGN